MFDNVKKEFIQENGVSNGDTTKRSDIFKDYQLSVNKDKRLSGTWTLEQYEGQYRSAMYAAVKAANPNWKPGQNLIQVFLIMSQKNQWKQHLSKMVIG